MQVLLCKECFDKYIHMGARGWSRKQSACLAPNNLASLVSLLPFVYSQLNYILKVIFYTFSSVQSTSVACGCWFVICLAWGSASLGHSHSPELRPTGKLINTDPLLGLHE